MAPLPSPAVGTWTQDQNNWVVLHCAERPKRIHTSHDPIPSCHSPPGSTLPYPLLRHTSLGCIHGSASGVGRFGSGRGSPPPVRRRRCWPARAPAPSRRGRASEPPDLGAQCYTRCSELGKGGCSLISQGQGQNMFILSRCTSRCLHGRQQMITQFCNTPPHPPRSLARD